MPSQLRTVSINGDITVDSITQHLNDTSSTYYDLNYNLIGDLDNDTFERAVESNPLPELVKIGSQGTISRSELFSDGTFTTLIGTETETYRVEQDNIPNNALYIVTTTERDSAGNVASTSTERFHLSADGTLSPIDVIDNDDEQTSILTFQ